MSGPKSLCISHAVHRGAFCQFPFRWIYYCHSSKSNGKKTGKTNLCVLVVYSNMCNRISMLKILYIMRTTIWWGKWFYHPINFLFFRNNSNPQWNSIDQKLVPICFTATYTVCIISEVIRVSECSTCIDYIDVVTELPCLFPGLIWPFFDFQMSWIHTLKWVNQVIKMLSTVNNVYLNFLFFNNNSNGEL